MKAISGLAAVALVLLVGCSTVDPIGSEKYAALEQELAEVTAERDALAAEINMAVSRYQKSTASQEAVAAIIDDPDSFGTKDEVLDLLMTYATEDAVMDDTAFSAVPMRQAWSNTLWGVDAKIKTWVKWVCDDGSQGGSLWTWTGSAWNGEPFELIGVDLDEYDNEGRISYAIVDWPYDSAHVLAAVSKGTGEVSVEE